MGNEQKPLGLLTNWKTLSIHGTVLVTIFKKFAIDLFDKSCISVSVQKYYL